MSFDLKKENLQRYIIEFSQELKDRQINGYDEFANNYLLELLEIETELRKMYLKLNEI